MPPIPQDTETPSEARIADLQKEERRWFSWLSVLHERGSRANSPNTAIVLDIAKKRWLKARDALQRQGVREQCVREQGADD